MTASATQGMGQQNGDATAAGGQIVEVTAWDFEPAEKLGGVVTNATGGFEGQIYGAISGKGKVTVLVPKTGYAVPFVFGADTVLNLYADKARAHGFQADQRRAGKRPGVDRPLFGQGDRDHVQFQEQRPLQRHRGLRGPGDNYNQQHNQQQRILKDSEVHVGSAGAKSLITDRRTS